MTISRREVKDCIASLSGNKSKYWKDEYYKLYEINKKLRKEIYNIKNSSLPQHIDYDDEDMERALKTLKKINIK